MRLWNGARSLLVGGTLDPISLTHSLCNNNCCFVCETLSFLGEHALIKIIIGNIEVNSSHFIFRIAQLNRKHVYTCLIIGLNNIIFTFLVHSSESPIANHWNVMKLYSWRHRVTQRQWIRNKPWLSAIWLYDGAVPQLTEKKNYLKMYLCFNCNAHIRFCVRVLTETKINISNELRCSLTLHPTNCSLHFDTPHKWN